MAVGSRRRLIYVEETVWGTTPTTPACTVLRNTGGSGIKLSRQTNQSKEMRSDRAIADLRMGNKNPSLEVPFELSYESFDDFLAAALFGTLAPGASGAALAITVDASTKTFNRDTGSWLTEGVKVGDVLTFSGFEDAGNNGAFVATAVSELAVTCSAAVGLVTVSADAGVSYRSSREVLKQGTTEHYFTIEEGFTDIAQYQKLVGAMVNGLSLSVKNNAMVEGSFSLIGKDAEPFTAVSIDAAPTAAPTSSPFDSYTGSLKEGGGSMAIATGIDLKIDNGLEALFALFNDGANKIGVGRCNLTGTVSCYFEDAAMANKFINETESSLEFTLTDLEGNSYTFLIPRLKYTGNDKTIAENNVGISLPFQALFDSTTGTTIQITKTPHA